MVPPNVHCSSWPPLNPVSSDSLPDSPTQPCLALSRDISLSFSVFGGLFSLPSNTTLFSSWLPKAPLEWMPLEPEIPNEPAGGAPKTPPLKQENRAARSMNAESAGSWDKLAGNIPGTFPEKTPFIHELCWFQSIPRILSLLDLKELRPSPSTTVTLESSILFCSLKPLQNLELCEFVWSFNTVGVNKFDIEVEGQEETPRSPLLMTEGFPVETNPIDSLANCQLEEILIGSLVLHSSSNSSFPFILSAKQQQKNHTISQLLSINKQESAEENQSRFKIIQFPEPKMASKNRKQNKQHNGHTFFRIIHNYRTISKQNTSNSSTVSKESIQKGRTHFIKWAKIMQTSINPSKGNSKSSPKRGKTKTLIRERRKQGRNQA